MRRWAEIKPQVFEHPTNLGASSSTRLRASVHGPNARLNDHGGFRRTGRAISGNGLLSPALSSGGEEGEGLLLSSWFELVRISAIADGSHGLYSFESLQHCCQRMNCSAPTLRSRFAA